MAYLFEGFANASSIFIGKAIGSNNEDLYKKTITFSWQWSILFAFFIACTYGLFQASLEEQKPIVIMYTTAIA
ncbi:hypothetical protein [Domibacillus iocasae]|uniref:Uncharacterized protein n=1 Tax=Domibacillus iocasae TaxID=1714016 RepID=A0A1E7DQX9_9BACI|nr:hypothetical protein [Domibacillus iocasae]OES45463.1 hypothetical protein BA724_17595 [Domibacillus iocasae]